MFTIPKALRGLFRRERRLLGNGLIAVRRVFRALARTQPRLLVLEDVHWADELTREAAAAISCDATVELLVLLLLHRPGYQPPQGSIRIALGDLRDESVARLLAAHLGSVSEAIATRVRERAGGNPFYVEEVVRHFLDVGILGPWRDGYRFVREPRGGDMPEGVESIIGARLDARLQPWFRVDGVVDCHGGTARQTLGGQCLGKE